MGRVLASHARATIVTVGTAAAVLLAGCSGGAGAQPGPSSGGPPSRATTSTSTASASPTPTASPSVTASVAVPAAARAHTDEGAKAFAEFYLKTYSRSAVAADSAPVRALSEPACGGCNTLIDLISRYKADGQHVDRDSLVIRDSSVRPGGTRDSVVVDVLTTDAPKQVLARDGSAVSKVAGARINFRITADWGTPGWKVADLRIIQ